MRGRTQADPPGLVAAGPGAVDADIWSRPWMDPWRSVGRRVADDIAQGAPVWQALARQAPAPVRFVPHTDLPAGVSYEAFIASTAVVSSDLSATTRMRTPGNLAPISPTRPDPRAFRKETPSSTTSGLSQSTPLA